MDKMNQLKDLLSHQVNDLYSAEEQIIEALPAMIEKAKDRKLKKLLQEHLRITELQKERLDDIMPLLEVEPAKKGFLSGLFGSNKCKGIEGLITEGERTISEDMDPDVRDAAIIASVQKIEHYEISGYGTARAYAEELGMGELVEVLRMIRDEEYEADNLLTELAVGRLNKEAVSQTNRNNRRAGSGRVGTSRDKQSSGNKRSGRAGSAAARTKTTGRATRKKSLRGNSKN